MISAHYARLLHRALSEHGISDDRVFAGLTLDAVALWQAPKLNPSEFLGLLQNARALIGDQALRTTITSRNRLAALGMMGVAMMSAPTLGDGLKAMSSFSTLEADYLHFRLLAGSQVTRIVLDIDFDLGDLLPLHVESVFVLLQEYLLDLAGNRPQHLHFTVTYPATQKRDSITTSLNGPINFAAKLTSIELPTTWLATRSPYSNAQAWQLARQHLGEQLQKARAPEDKPFTRHLQSVLQSSQPPFPDIQEVAEALHISPRTLSRRLMEEDTSYRRLKLLATHEYAKGMLLDGASVESIAAELGYENAANFRRSFRAINQSSPKEWVQSQQAAVP
ncbi:MAG: AraC family transcriptional regulator ligand-binding domain-containing protein [Cellvibrionales bacterium]